MNSTESKTTKYIAIIFLTAFISLGCGYGIGLVYQPYWDSTCISITTYPLTGEKHMHFNHFVNGFTLTREQSDKIIEDLK